MQYPILSQSLRSFRQKYITVEVGGPRPREASGELGCWHVDNEGIRDLCHEPLFVVDVIHLCRSCRSPSFSCFRLAHSHRAGTASQSPHCYFHNRDKGGQQCFCNTYAPQTYQQKYQSEESKRKSFLLPSFIPLPIDGQLLWPSSTLLDSTQLCSQAAITLRWRRGGETPK